MPILDLKKCNDAIDKSECGIRILLNLWKLLILNARKPTLTLRCQGSSTQLVQKIYVLYGRQQHIHVYGTTPQRK